MFGSFLEIFVAVGWDISVVKILQNVVYHLLVKVAQGNIHLIL